MLTVVKESAQRMMRKLQLNPRLNLPSKNGLKVLMMRVVTVEEEQKQRTTLLLRLYLWRLRKA